MPTQMEKSKRNFRENLSKCNAIAAKKLGRKYVGFDLDEKYVQISKAHLDNVKADSKIGNSWVSFYLNQVRTLRDKDWDSLLKSFDIPENLKDIEFTKIELKK